MKVTMLGTGHAMVTEYYNTCFALQNTVDSADPAVDSQAPVFLVDGGGGSMILHNLKHTGIKVSQIHDVFVSHHHIDHMTGVIWIVRAITSEMSRGTYLFASGPLEAYGRLLQAGYRQASGGIHRR